MFCRKCGRELTDNSAFCPFCGCQIKGTQEPVNGPGYNTQQQAKGNYNQQPQVNRAYNSRQQERPGYNTQSQEKAGHYTQSPERAGHYTQQPERAGYSSQPKKSNRLPLIIIIAAAAAAVLILFLCLGNSKTEINLNQYLSVGSGGVNGSGNASWSFDFSRMVKDYPDACKITKANSDKLTEIISGADSYTKELVIGSNPSEEDVIKYYLSTVIYGKLDRDRDLSNGDEITFTWKVDDESLNTILNVVPVYSSVVHKVDSLTEPQITPEPVATPEPTAAPEPTAEPTPTSEPTPSSEPVPTKVPTATPSSEPVPTKVPTPSPEPEPGDVSDFLTDDYVGTYKGMSDPTYFDLTVNSQEGNTINFDLEWYNLKVALSIETTTATVENGVCNFSAPVYGGHGANGQIQDFSLAFHGDTVILTIANSEVVLSRE